MAKSLLDILNQPFPKPTSVTPNENGMTPLAGETTSKDLLKQLTVSKHPDPYGNDFSGGVKAFDRAANRFGYNYSYKNDYNNQSPSRPLANPTLNVDTKTSDKQTRAFEAVDSVGLGATMHYRVVNLRTGEYITRKMPRNEAEQIANDLNSEFVKQLNEEEKKSLNYHLMKKEMLKVKRDAAKKEVKKEEVETLDEGVSRKHFQDVANTVRAIEHPGVRQEYADHHAEIFARQNPRFDHARFHAAAGTKTKEERAHTSRHRNIGKIGEDTAVSYTKEAKRKAWKSDTYPKKPVISNNAGTDADLTEVAPPGREDQVKELKKKFPGDKAAAFKIAWSSYNKSHKEDVDMERLAKLREGWAEKAVSRLYKAKEGLTKKGKAGPTAHGQGAGHRGKNYQGSINVDPKSGHPAGPEDRAMKAIADLKGPTRVKYRAGPKKRRWGDFGTTHKAGATGADIYRK